MLAEGVLPDGALVKLALQQDAENLQPLVDALAAWPVDSAQRKTFHLDMARWQLLGSIGQVYPGATGTASGQQTESELAGGSLAGTSALSAAKRLQQPTQLLTLDNGKLLQYELMVPGTRNCAS